jgi:hypothetical protein
MTTEERDAVIERLHQALLSIRTLTNAPASEAQRDRISEIARGALTMFPEKGN